MSRKKSNLILLFLLFILIGCQTQDPDNNEKKGIHDEENSFDINSVQSGDIIFQSTLGDQSDMVSSVTHSPFSHCGLILKNKNNSPDVYEANGEVQITPLKDWIKHGKNQQFLIMRLKKEIHSLSAEEIEKSQLYLESILGWPYDIKFLWNDDEIYCSELVWKVYKNAINIELCPLKKLKEYDLKNARVMLELAIRHNNNIPFEEFMVAPSDIADSDLLEKIYSNYQ